MKLSASFDEGRLSLLLITETEAEQRMIGAVIDQPQTALNCGYLDKTLISASLQYEGHFSNQRISSVRLNIFRPNKEQKS